MAKMAKNCQRLMTTKFWTHKTHFFIQDKNLYIQNIGHIWAYIHADSWDF